MRTIKSLSTGLALGLSLLLIPSPVSAQKTLTLGGSDSIGSLLDRQNALFTKLVNERAAGKLKINFIQGEQLGNDQQVIEQLAAKGYRVVSGPVGLELEVEALDEADRAEFAAAMGLTESSRTSLLRAIFEVTDLITFYTTDEKEVHAWLIERGATALDAAGLIHTDLARGFIRAEIMAVADLLRLGSEREVKAANRHHVVGKDYVMQDGDEIVVRFSV